METTRRQAISLTRVIPRKKGKMLEDKDQISGVLFLSQNTPNSLDLCFGKCYTKYSGVPKNL